MNSAVKAVRTWAEMVKLSHSIFALPFAVMAALLAGRHIELIHHPQLGQFGLILICMVAARSVAMTFNRIVDARIDARNPRTAGRPIPTGKLSLHAANLMLVLATITFGMGCLAFYYYYENTWPILLSGPVLIYLCLYSLTKRFTRWSHLYLGSAIGLSPAAAWLAVHPDSLGATALALSLTVMCWIAGFDIIYACQDIEVDRKDNLHSLPSRIGPKRALLIARFLHALTVAGLVWIGSLEALGNAYWTGVVVVLALLVVENSLVRPGDYSKVNLAFFTMNGAVSVALAVALLVDLFVA